MTEKPTPKKATAKAPEPEPQPVDDTGAAIPTPPETVEDPDAGTPATTVADAAEDGGFSKEERDAIELKVSELEGTVDALNEELDKARQANGQYETAYTELKTENEQLKVALEIKNDDGSERAPKPTFMGDFIPVGHPEFARASAKTEKLPDYVPQKFAAHCPSCDFIGVGSTQKAADASLRAHTGQIHKG